MPEYIKFIVLFLLLKNLNGFQNPSIITVQEIPRFDLKLMPYVGNGHLASTVFDDTIYVNGVYNGKEGASHRAKVPNMHGFELKTKNLEGVNRNYSMDFGHGVFIERLEDESFYVERRIFAHQYFNRLLISQIKLNRKKGTTGSIVLPIEYTNDILGGILSDDFNFDPIEQRGEYYILRGHTIDIEFEQFQKNSTPIIIYFTLPKDLVLESNEDETIYNLISSIDINENTVQEEMIIALDYIYSGRSEELYQLHASTFSDFWEYGHIEVDNFDLQQTIIASSYYLMSSLPALKHHGQLNQFYGLSPGSLSRGAKGRDYQGHSFWDSETWMYPSVLMFYPSIAKEILSYRIYTSDAAAYNAKLFNCSGWKYAWESAYTGYDVTPDCCPGGKLYELHINGDIGFAARQYVSATRDINWLINENGNTLIQNIAEYWNSRINYNNTKKQYEIKGVIPPDEDAQPFVDNSIYTNTISSLSIFFANYSNCLTNSKQIPLEWFDKARCMYSTYSEENKINLEYENYKIGTEIKQADVVLLGYPLLWQVSPDVRYNDLFYYENVTRSTGPAMTWSMHSIGHIDIKDFEKANELFEKSYSIYTRKPFLTWTESQDGLGTVNFITGVGGFLQAVVFGYSGLRLHVESLTIDSDLPLPPNSTYLYLHKIKYLNSIISLNYTETAIHLYVDFMDSTIPLELLTNSQLYPLKSNFDMDLPKNKFVYTIRSSIPTNFPLPYDKIDRNNCDDS